MTISRESWHREANNLEKELKRLRKLLFENQISDFEYAKAVMRLHPSERDKLLSKAGDLEITEGWMKVHEPVVKDIQNSAERARDLAESHQNDTRFREFMAQALGWDPERDSTFTSLGNLFYHLSRQYDPNTTALVFEDVSSRGPNILRWPAPTKASSEKQFTNNVYEVRDGIKGLLDIMQQAIR